MKEDYVECPELSGKTIQTVRIYKKTDGEAEIHLDLRTEQVFPALFVSRQRSRRLCIRVEWEARKSFASTKYSNLLGGSAPPLFSNGITLSLKVIGRFGIPALALRHS